MQSSAPKPSGVVTASKQYWQDLYVRDGALAATTGLLKALWSFVRNSTPERQRRLYGDFDFDWQYRVNTMSGGVGWRERLLGELHSLYQPTEPGAFHEMLGGLLDSAKVDYADFIFVDLGSGKGRTLMMASDYPFRRIIGVELLPALNEVARENLGLYKNESKRCNDIESVCADATTFPLPAAPLVIYLFNPFPELPLRRVLANIAECLRRNQEPAYVLYHNPEQEHVLAEDPNFSKLVSAQQYSIYRFNL